MENEPWKPLYTVCICQMIGRKMRRTLKTNFHNSSWNSPSSAWILECFMTNWDGQWSTIELPNVLIRHGLFLFHPCEPACGSQLSAAGAGAESLMSFSRRKPQTSRPVANWIRVRSGVPDAQSWDNWATPCWTADRKRFQSVVKRCSKSLIPDGSANAFPFSLICSSPSAHVKLFCRLPSRKLT